MNRPAFHFRKVIQADLPHLVGLLPPALRFEADTKQRLPVLWKQFVDAEAKSFCVVEDLERPYPDGLEGFGLSVFVTDSFADEFCANPQPYFPEFFYKRALGGEHIVLDSEQLRAANCTNGINIALLHFGLRNEDLSNLRTAEAVKVGSAAFYFFHMGYKVRLIINEVYGSGHRNYMAAGGLPLTRDYQSDAPAQFAAVPPEHYPYLFALRDGQLPPGAVNPLSQLSQLFGAPEPRLGFSRAERQLLERALLNETDAQIAKVTGVSPDAVKKTWGNIYARVERAAPFLMPDTIPSLGIRGQEKRRHLLEYIRMHLEELRPGCPAPANRGRRPGR